MSAIIVPSLVVKRVIFQHILYHVQISVLSDEIEQGCFILKVSEQ